MVVSGTPRDSPHVPDALLNLDGGVEPEMAATDNASYSDMVFGLFKILGYNFSPRFRNLDDQRFWRATMPGVATGTYGVLEDLARNRVNLNKVTAHWPDMLRVAGSLVTDQVRAYGLLRMFGREGRPTPLGQAFAEYGRLARTEHLLRVVDPVDDTCRRQMNRQLTVQESRHKLARDVCHGKRGTIHQAYRDGMEDQLGALGPVLDAIVLWTTRCIDAAVAQLRAEGHEIRDEDIARLSPLKHRNLHLLGRYSFRTSTPAGGVLRPLRDPDTPGLDEDDDGSEERTDLADRPR
jgi:TnpA family transposase